MKCGTTSLWAELSRTGEVFVPANKEPGTLAIDGILERPQLIARYLKNFQAGDGFDLRADLSTDMAKNLEYPAAASNANALLSSDLKLVYLTRDPLQRILSHYRHSCAIGLFRGSLAEFSCAAGSPVDISRYARQLSAWRKYFPQPSFYIDDLANYRSNRQAFLQNLFSFLGIDSSSDDSGPATVPRNVNAVGPKGAFARGIVSSDLYRRRISPSVPSNVKNVARRLLERRTQRPTDGWSAVSESQRKELHELFAAEIEELASVWGYSPPWAGEYRGAN